MISTIDNYRNIEEYLDLAPAKVRYKEYRYYTMYYLAYNDGVKAQFKRPKIGTPPECTTEYRIYDSNGYDFDDIIWELPK